MRKNRECTRIDCYNSRQFVSIRGFFESSHGEVKVSGRIHLWLQKWDGSVRISGSSESSSSQSSQLVFRAGHRAATNCANDQADPGWRLQIFVDCCAKATRAAPHPNIDRGRYQDFELRIPSPDWHSTIESNEEGRKTGW